jgi:hypothetical protein
MLPSSPRKRLPRRALYFALGIVLLALVQFRAIVVAFFLAPPCTTIPKIIHQTWKHDMVSHLAAQRIQSWLVKNPDWEWRLWTNEDNLRFMREHYPEHYPTFAGYQQEVGCALGKSSLAPSANPHLLPRPLPCDIQIKRADAIRYFLLDHFGGLYIDLDFEALRPIDDLLTGHGLVIGQEPYVHSRVLYNVDRLMCNAFMASCPRHPFWGTVHAELEARKHITKGGKHVMDATGPRMINDAVNAYEASEAATTYPLFVPDAGTIYPNHDTENPNLRPICQNKTGALSARRVEPCKKLEENNYYNAPLTARSFAVHHWQHSWVGFGYFEVDRINSTKLAADVRAGRTTTLDQAYGQEYEGDGVWGGDWDGIPSITGECEADKAKLCADVKPGGHRTHLCLDKARADQKLSPECADSATFRPPPPTPSWSVPVEDYGTPSRLQDEGTMWTPDMILGITEECEADKKRLCADVKPGNHR